MAHSGFVKKIESTAGTEIDMPDGSTERAIGDRLISGFAPGRPDDMGWVVNEIHGLSLKVGELEKSGGSDASTARAMIELSGRTDRLEKYVTGLSSQQAMVEMQMERNARATALDLAIKYVGQPDALKADPAGMDVTLIAEGFLTWLKAGQHA